MSIIAEVRAEIARQGITTKRLAEETGLKLPYLSLRLNEHRDFLSGELDAIGNILGIPAWEIFHRAKEDTPALADTASLASGSEVV